MIWTEKSGLLILRTSNFSFVQKCRILNINNTEAEEIEMRVFGAPNAIRVLGEGQEHGGLQP